MNELHFVTDPRKSVKEWVSVCRKAGEWLDWIHLRKPGASTAELQDWGLTLIREVGVDPKRLTVNGNVEVAENLGCGGVHLPERHPVDTIFTGGGNRRRVGCSVHSRDSAREKEQQGADYLFFGHVFASDSKPGRKPRGIRQLRQVTAAVNIPVIAIGGITPERLPQLSTTGCAGVAVISAIADAPDPAAAARRLKQALQLEWVKQG
ncbi:thiamine phosphate synthase [Kroppenstedtia eburnea]|uniref:Thiazole tautomerase (Transcriptional regulator TenI) n=1 Tax=Kroppenstedtia eburnea TaxID=714067 RepID=A0A1N7PS40_9BACL|nr:thiamine phosphate synthase [Kroppenstedtia eburnea]QKI82684.1 thiamine phosphate synthase [Kroppenstedtia eburnea]SIT13386.1 thiazole tautomerase (transcriptional regulator TenI) [Kroppenstedtia eburnea]